MDPSELSALVDRHEIRVVSTDLFDTVLLRDRSTQTVRLREASRRAALVLGVDAEVLTRLRWDLQANAYRAVHLERATGEASLARISRTAARALGLNATAARIIETSEVEVDIRHLRPHRALVDALTRVAASGTRVIAVSDTYYSTAALHRILGRVVGPHPLQTVYSSSDLGLTKHSGALYPEVARQEHVRGRHILHLGDNLGVDVHRAREASWEARHLPRPAQEVALRRLAQVGAVGARRQAAR